MSAENKSVTIYRGRENAICCVAVTWNILRVKNKHSILWGTNDMKISEVQGKSKNQSVWMFLKNQKLIILSIYSAF